MTSKRWVGALLAVICAGVGVVRWLDLAGNTDMATGYLASGGLAVRYVVLAAPVLLMALAALAVPANSNHRMPAGAAVPAFCGMLFSGIIGACLHLLRGGSTPALAASVLLLAGGLWFAGYALKGGEASLVLGIITALSWLFVSMVLFFTRTASAHHILLNVELMGCLASLLLVSALLRGAYQQGAGGVSRTVFFGGMVSFYAGTCLLLPQELWQWHNRLAVGFLQGKFVAAGLLGVSGLIVALHCLDEADEPARTDEDPEAAFARAGRRLQEDLEQDGEAPRAPLFDDEEAPPARAAYERTPAYETEYEHPDRPARGNDAAARLIQAAAGDREDPQPLDRWQSAAATLYGAAPSTAEPRTARRRRPAPPPMEEQVIAAPMAEDGEDLAPPAARPPQTPPASLQPADLFAAADDAPPAAAQTPRETDKDDASAPAPDAAASTLDRLDSLLAQLNDRPGAPAPDEDLLTDLGRQSRGPSPAEDTSNGEKWVFRRK